MRLYFAISLMAFNCLLHRFCTFGAIFINQIQKLLALFISIQYSPITLYNTDCCRDDKVSYVSFGFALPTTRAQGLAQSWQSFEVQMIKFGFDFL